MKSTSREKKRVVPKRHSKRCNICGRFVPAEGKWPCVFYDDYMGAWEHE